MAHRQIKRVHRQRRFSGFTMVELLVVITIVVILAALAFFMMRNAKTAAQSTICISRLRNAGTLLLSAASDNGGRVQAFSGGSGGFDYRPYYVVARELGLSNDNSGKTALKATLEEVMFCPSAPTPDTEHWTCYGVNFTNSTRAGATWTNEKITDTAGRIANVKSLNLASVGSPSDYILIADSCRSDGQQIFRISGGDRIGLRHSHKANACFLDGSARPLTTSDLGRLGFKEAYDTASDPPQTVSLPQSP